MNIRAIIFDYDGVLVNSEVGAYKILGEVLAQRHHIYLSPDLFKLKVGRSTVKFLETNFSSQLSADEIEQIYSECFTIFQNNLEKYCVVHQPVIEAIKKLANNHLVAIASMSQKSRIELMLKKLHIEKCISAVLSRENITHHKPHPEVYLKCLKSLDLTPQSALAVEDSVVGAQAAIAAGIPTVGLLNEINSKQEFAQLHLYSITTLKDVEHDLLTLCQ